MPSGTPSIAGAAQREPSFRPLPFDGRSGLFAIALGSPWFDDFSAVPAGLPEWEDADLLMGSTLTEINPAAGAVTVYLGTFEDAADSVVALPVPAGQISGLYVRATTAPGAGKSFAYAVQKNGVAQTMATTLSGGSDSGSTAANPVSCATGDRISVRLIADQGAAIAHHSFTLRYQIAA